MIPFVKTQRLGNDCMLVEQTSKIPADYAELGKRICHRYFGVGADGLIVWMPSGDVFRLRIFNRDGSEAECSGNGLRCVAAYLIESGTWPQSKIQLETISGLYTLTRIGGEYEADMGVPKLSPEEIPFIPAAPIDRVVNYPIALEGETVSITACSTGNPHCSLFVDSINENFVRT